MSRILRRVQKFRQARESGFTWRDEPERAATQWLLGGGVSVAGVWAKLIGAHGGALACHKSRFCAAPAARIDECVCKVLQAS